MEKVGLVGVGAMGTALLERLRLAGVQPRSPGMPLELAPGGACAIGMEVGVDFVSLLLADFLAQPIWRKRVTLDSSLDQRQFIERAGAAVGYLVLSFADPEDRGARRAYVSGLYLHPEERGRGLGLWLVRTVLDHPELQGLRRWLLITRAVVFSMTPITSGARGEAGPGTARVRTETLT